MRLKMRYAVGAFIKNKQNQYLVVRKKRNKTGNFITTQYWDIPKGGVEKRETLVSALKREMREELGTNKFRNMKKLKSFIYYDYPRDLQKATGFKGQKNFLFAVDFVGRKNDIKIDHQENDKFYFLSAKDFVKKVTYPSTKKIFKEYLTRRFAPSAL